MYNQLHSWKGSVEIDGTLYESIEQANKALIGASSIKLLSKSKKPNMSEMQAQTGTYKILVKHYMTRKATPEFDFMAKWNNDIPMPMRIMVGKVKKETAGMVYMELHADILQERTFSCMKCGKTLKNPVSQYFGIGPECGGHNYTSPFDSEEELQEAVKMYRKELQNITWEGWIIKSAIIEKEEM